MEVAVDAEGYLNDISIVAESYICSRCGNEFNLCRLAW